MLKYEDKANILYMLLVLIEKLEEMNLHMSKSHNYFFLYKNP